MVAKRPNSKRNLDMALRRMGGADEEFVRRRTLVANAIVGNLMPSGAVKGGSAMKVRFGDANTRASTELDVARREDLEAFLRGLGDALAVGWEGFEGRAVHKPAAHPRDVPATYVMQPFDVKMSYLGVPWCTVQLELGHNEIGDADEPDMVVPRDANEILGSMGFPGLGPIPTMPLHHQIAQKLQARASRSPRTRRRRRFHRRAHLQRERHGVAVRLGLSSGMAPAARHSRNLTPCQGFRGPVGSRTAPW